MENKFILQAHLEFSIDKVSRSLYLYSASVLSSDVRFMLHFCLKVYHYRLLPSMHAFNQN